MTYRFFTVDDSRTVNEHAGEGSPASLLTSTAIGVFRADPRRLTERHFDIHLAASPWGTREVIFRLPGTDFPLPLAAQYGAEAWAVGGHSLVAFRTDFAGRGAKADFPLERLAGVRAALAAGDHRALYLGWLALLGHPDQYGPDELRELAEEFEPPVPPGLNAPDAGLRLLAEILCVDARLLRAAAAPAPARRPGAATGRRTVAALLRAAARECGRREAG
ncbi:hypothetical protein ACFV1L_09190 [Kitasatospora sp. NPDC059646]|uniref:hypothetical protein n=1 Tax=Kitasatospora sp. NPDC059646 TaxID=3346893 RepID=UPI003673D339